MKEKWTNNWGLKLGSVTFAIILWIIVTNVNDPVIQYKITNVPVKFIHTDVITNQGKVFEVLDGTDVIDQVTITAARSIIDSLSDQNVVAVADFNDMTVQETINIRLSTNKYNEKLESIKGNVEEVKLKIENKKTISLPLRATTTGEVSEGYLLGDITTDRNLVKISGPESVVSTIVKADVDVAIADFTSNISTDADIKLYDVNGEEVDRALVSMNISTVKVNVEILQTKRVPISFSASGKPADGYQMTGQIESSISSIMVAGRANVINSVNEIQIPEEALNVTGQTDNMMAIVQVADYLPNGLSLVNSGAGTVTVTVYIEPKQNEEYMLSPSAVQIRNVPSGYKVTVDENAEEFAVTLSGLASKLALANANSITAYLNMNQLFDTVATEDLKDDYYELPVEFEVSVEGVDADKTVQTLMVLVEKIEE